MPELINHLLDNQSVTAEALAMALEWPDANATRRARFEGCLLLTLGEEPALVIADSVPILWPLLTTLGMSGCSTRVLASLKSYRTPDGGETVVSMNCILTPRSQAQSSTPLPPEGLSKTSLLKLL